jgi:hypothetical protein
LTGAAQRPVKAAQFLIKDAKAMMCPCREQRHGRSIGR